jgi:hypothetical protein
VQFSGYPHLDTAVPFVDMKTEARYVYISIFGFQAPMVYRMKAELSDIH